MIRFHMFTTMLVSAILAFATACACECDQRSGTYRVITHRESGDCPELGEQIIVLTRQPRSPADVDAACSGSITYSEDNCTVALDSECPAPSDMLVRERGEAEWSCDGDTGEAHVDATWIDAMTDMPACSSTYRYDYERL